MPGFPVHQLPELAETHVHQVTDAIHPSHPLLSPSSTAFNLSQHQGLYKLIMQLGQHLPGLDKLVRGGYGRPEETRRKTDATHRQGGDP